MLKIHQLICSFSLCHFISWSFLLFGMDKNLHLDLGQLDKFYMGLSLETINCFLLWTEIKCFLWQMKPTNSQLSEIEKEGASDYPWTPWKESEMDLLCVWNLMTIPNNISIFHQMVCRARLFCCHWALLVIAHKGTKLDHGIFMCPMLFPSFVLEKKQGC